MGDCLLEEQEKYQEAIKMGLICSAMKHGDCIGDEFQVFNSNGICFRRMGDSLRMTQWLKLAAKRGSGPASRNIARLNIF